MSNYRTVLLSRAYKAYSLRQFRKALKICSKIIKLGYTSSEVMILIAKILLALEDSKLCDIWSPTFSNLCVSSSDPDLTYAYGLFLRLCGSYEESTKYLEKALALSPDKKEYYFELNTNYYILREAQKQLDLLITATTRFPNEPQFWYLLGSVYHRKKQLEAAKESYLQAVKLSPSNLRYCEKLADIAFQLKDYSTARKYFEQAFNIDPVNSFISWTKLLVIYYVIERDKAKTEELLKSVEEHALDVPEKWLRLGDFYFFTLNDYARALSAYEKIYSSKLDDIEFLQRILDCTLELKQYSKGIKILKQSIRHEKTHGKLLLLAELLAKEGDLNKAEETYKKAIKHAIKHSFYDSDQSHCFLKYGLFLEEIKEDPTAAKEAYLKAFEIYQFNLVALSRYNKITGEDYFWPLVTSAVPKFGYLLGKDDQYEALVLDNISALGHIQYKYMLILYPTYNSFPLYIVALETNPIAILSNNYFFCAFTGSKHLNYGSWKETIDIETFAEKALDLVIKNFNIEPETIRKIV